MTKEEIRKLALECGFHLKMQDDGSKDLNPYVYQFAGKLCERVAQAGLDAHQALLAMISEDLRKVLEKLNAHETKAAIEGLESTRDKLNRHEKVLQNKNSEPEKIHAAKHNIAEMEELKKLLMETGLSEDAGRVLIVLSRIGRP